jgi:putative ABC transport system permease protein
MSVAVSVTFIYLVVLVCAWYPSRLATRIHPAEALHYE